MAGYAHVAGRGDRLRALSAEPAALDIWASPEPSVARIDATVVRDQGRETGWLVRGIADVDRIADLGVQACRYPVLWEHVAPQRPDVMDFSLAQAGVARLRERGVTPIVTLLHHGSGPFFTDLLDPDFPARFAAYASAAARALPEVRRWTPINEPLTTARFATLYDVWYPNMSDDRAFGRALVHQMQAIAGAMRAIRAVRPDAELVLTEDLQRFTAGDAGVEEYVAFLRERMYLSAELLAGRVDRAHALHGFLVERCGVSDAELAQLVAAPCPPDLVALDHYPHSERYIFTASDGTIGDVPAVYVAGEPAPRVGPLLRAAAARLRLPLAVGEVHIDAPAAERVRWLAQHVADVRAARAAGVDVRAVGVWAAFGMVDWHSLLRARENAVEDGIYTFAGPFGVPQPTALAAAVRTLAAGGTPVTDVPAGWWERDERLRAPHDLLAARLAGGGEGAHMRAAAGAAS